MLLVKVVIIFDFVVFMGFLWRRLVIMFMIIFVFFLLVIFCKIGFLRWLWFRKVKLVFFFDNFNLFVDGLGIGFFGMRKVVLGGGFFDVGVLFLSKEE